MTERVVVVDTDAWSLLFLTPRKTVAEVAGWRRTLVGSTVVIAAQTSAEVRYGALKANWGEGRLAQLESVLARFPIVPVGDEVVRAHANLRAQCQRIGHPLHEKNHVGDAWVAASAAAHELPLLARDAIYRGVPTLRLLGVDT